MDKSNAAQSSFLGVCICAVVTAYADTRRAGEVGSTAAERCSDRRKFRMQTQRKEKEV